MIQEKERTSLAQLLDLYESEELQNSQKKAEVLQLILTHDQIKSCLKNQAQVLKRIFTYSHLETLIQYIKQENQEHAQFMKSIKYDPSGQYIPLCLKLPFMAMEIFCCQCQLINDILFNGVRQNPVPLLPKLLQFLEQPPHYHLASYFSKIICAITKRVSSTSHKYNQIFSEWIFGKDSSKEEIQKCALFKSIKHFYSLSSLDYITKWLLMNCKETIQSEVDGQLLQKTIVSFKKSLKMTFLIRLLNILNTAELEEEIINNIPILFEQMLSQLSTQKKISSSLALKSFGLNANTKKVTLYDLAVDQQIISEVFKVPEEGCLTLAKISLIKIYLKRYAQQIGFIQKQKSDEEDQPQTKLLQVINPDNIFYLFEWIIEHLKIYLRITSKNISSQNSSHIQQQSIEDSRVLLPSSQKMIILHLCQVLRLIHSMENCKFQLTQFYNLHSSTLVNLIKRLMMLENNLIQIEISKIVLSMIKMKNKEKDLSIPFDFARKLLLHSIISLIEISSAREHVIQWADILLSLETEHIFEDCQEQFEWEHIREVVEHAKQLQIGQFRMIQSNIDCFYSQEKALIKYAHFLHDYTAEVLYEDKKELKKLMSEKKISEQQKKQSEVQKVQEQEEEINQMLVLINDFGANYLSFNLENLISEL